MAFETLIVDVEDHVCVIKLNRPEALNALNKQLLEELAEALEDSQKNITNEDGIWWSINWYDNAISGLFSGSDKYEIRTNSPSIFNVRFYDNWAESWTDSII